MVRRIYSICDNLSGFSSVVADDSDSLAARGFKSTVIRMLSSDPASAPYVDDMSLWYVGDFDSFSGTVAPADKRELVVRGSVVRAEYENSLSEVNKYEEV